MRQYLNIVRDVIETGVRKPNRTGIDTIAGFSYNFKHDLANGFPLLTTKRMDGGVWKSLVQELLWFLSGENHIRNLRNHTSIWNEWADDDGNLETAYGFYWRNFPYAFSGKMATEEEYMQTDWLARNDTEMGVGLFDQVAWIVDQLKTNPNSRRLVCSAWEPMNAHKSKLPPCHFAWVVNVQGGRLNLQWIQRSCDLGLGVPFNIASYALLCHILAQETGLQVGYLSGLLIDAHIYCADEGDNTPIIANPATGETSPRSDFDHVKVLRQQLEREPLPLCQIQIADKPMSSLQFEDFELVNYQSHDRLRMKIAP